MQAANLNGALSEFREELLLVASEDPQAAANSARIVIAKGRMPPFYVAGSAKAVTAAVTPLSPSVSDP
jgi:hypothetical protein